MKSLEPVKGRPGPVGIGGNGPNHISGRWFNTRLRVGIGLVINSGGVTEVGTLVEAGAAVVEFLEGFVFVATPGKTNVHASRWIGNATRMNKRKSFLFFTSPPIVFHLVHMAARPTKDDTDSCYAVIMPYYPKSAHLPVK
jgi:hypothetical protein